MWVEQRALGMTISDIARASKVGYATVAACLRRAAAGASS
jgi:hypothetical protein